MLYITTSQVDFILIQKIILAVSISIIVAFLFLSVFLFLSQYKIHDGIPVLQGDDTYESQKKFYLTHVSENEKRIFLLGSSQIIALNTTYIDNYLLLHTQQHYRVYNLASNSDQPKERLKTLDMMLSAKPIIVVYGIAPRDFQDPLVTSELSKPSSFLPDPEYFFHKITKMGLDYMHLDLSFMESPKIITLQHIKAISKAKDVETTWIPYPDTFLKITKSSIITNTADELKSRIPFTTPITKIDAIDNDNLAALEEIIKKFNYDNIRVIIFTVPESQVYLSTMPQSYKDSFNSIIKELSSIQGTPVSRLDGKYADLHVWEDPIHMAINNSTFIYSEDVAKIILSEALS